MTGVQTCALPICYNASKYIRNRGALSQSSRASSLAMESCQSRGSQHLIAEIDKGMSPVAASSSSLTADVNSKAQDVVKDVNEGDPVNAPSGALYGDKNILNCEDLGTMFVINRLRALNVPPLPPDLGSLQHANGKAYR